MGDLNEQQREIVETTEGFVAVDAGPGTGKTATVTERCLKILGDRNVSGRDIVMLTFTRNAAAEMKERVSCKISERLEAQEKALREYEKAPSASEKPDVKDYGSMLKKSKEMFAGTFDSFSLSVVTQYPSVACREIGIAGVPGHHPYISDNVTRDRIYFSRFLSDYLEKNDAGKYAPVFSANAESLSNLIAKLLSQCIVPKKSGGWFYRSDFINGDYDEIDHLTGDRETLEKTVGQHGLGKEVFDPKKFITPPGISVHDAVYDSSQKELIDAVHDLFLAFIEKSVLDNRMSFGLIKCLALITLHRLRKAEKDPGAPVRTEGGFRYKYVIIDEFQDTNSTEMAIALLILKRYKDNLNLCVVGDWKQGIYGFKYADINNLLEFYGNLSVVKRRLLKAVDSPSLVPENGKKYVLRKNYRSSQLIIDCAYRALGIPVSGDGKTFGGYAPEQTGTLEACEENRDLGCHTAFERVTCPDESRELDEVVLSVTDFTEDPKYRICGKDAGGKEELRAPSYGDIAVLCQTNLQCRKVKAALDGCGIPAYINGDQEIMDTMEAKLLLAWLRFVENRDDPLGYVPILAMESYSAEEICGFTGKNGEKRKLPEKMTGYRKVLLRRKRRIVNLVSSVFEYYGLDNDITQSIITVIASLHRNNMMTISDVIMLIESDIGRGATYPVDNSPDSDSVTVQTIHKSKGLEYPVVIVPFVDGRSFPRTGRMSDGIFTLNDTVGMRCSKTVVTENGNTWETRDWKTYAVKRSVEEKPDIINEQRRLFFVAISRAKQYVRLIASSVPSEFFTGFDDGTVGAPSEMDGNRKLPDLRGEMKRKQTIERPQVPAYRPRRIGIGVHDILHFGGDISSDDDARDSESVRYCEADGSRGGMERGTEVHLRAQRLVEDHPLSDRELKEYPELKNVAEAIANLPDGDPVLRSAETECYLPVGSVKHPGRTVTLRGIIDMVYVDGETIEIHDWKTDRSDDFCGEYMIQLSIYAHAASGYYERTSGKKRRVRCVIDWLNGSNPSFPKTVFEPLPIGEIAARVDDYLDGRPDDGGLSESEDLDEDYRSPAEYKNGDSLAPYKRGTRAPGGAKMNTKTMIAVLAAAVFLAGAVSFCCADGSAAGGDGTVTEDGMQDSGTGPALMSCIDGIDLDPPQDKRVDFGGLLEWITVVLLIFAIACVAMAIYCKLYNDEY